MVGLIPLYAVETLEPEIIDRLPGFKRRLQWFIGNARWLAEVQFCGLVSILERECTASRPRSSY